MNEKLLCRIAECPSAFHLPRHGLSRQIQEVLLFVRTHQTATTFTTIIMASLTTNDNAVLSRLFDPEAAPTSSILVDPSLPAEPHVHDENTLAKIRWKEKTIISIIESVLRELQSATEKKKALTDAYRDMSDLVDEYPQCASIRNNRAQLFRLQHGDHVLIPATTPGTLPQFSDLASTALNDLNTAISLLSPATPQSAVSPIQCRTMAQAYTQRGALYHAASKSLSSLGLPKASLVYIQELDPRFEGWTVLDFEEAASRDFFMGGRYGNEVGKALAVHTNPTAKLCGQMVQEAMKREYSNSTVVVP